VKDLNKIDELLRDNMQDFTPDVPADAWSSISNKLNTPPATTGIKVLKGLSGGLKAGILISSVAIITTLIVLFSDNKAEIKPREEASNSQKVNSSNQINSEILKESESIIFENKSSKIKKSQVAQKADKINEQSVNEFNDEILISKQKESSLIKQEVNKPQFESLVNKEVKTEIVEGNPEKEADETVGINETKAEESEVKRDYPLVHNAISPNGDGMNDELVVDMPPHDFYRMRIYTKRGELVFETEAINNRWKGLIQGSNLLAENGEYRYIVEYQIKGIDRVKVIGGFILLNR
jgi:hypothetical protein